MSSIPAWVAHDRLSAVWRDFILRSPMATALSTPTPEAQRREEIYESKRRRIEILLAAGAIQSAHGGVVMKQKIFDAGHLDRRPSYKRRRGLYDTLAPRVLAALAAIPFFVGCSTQQSVEQQRAQVLIHQQRAAIQLVADQIEASVDKINKDQASTHEPKAVVRRVYETFLNTDVSACPDDFRAQYERVVDSLRQLLNAVNDVPTDGMDDLIYLISQLNSPNPDLQGKSLARNVDVKLQELQATNTELKAIGHRYGVNSRFGW